MSARNPVARGTGARWARAGVDVALPATDSALAGGARLASGSRGAGGAGSAGNAGTTSAGAAAAYGAACSERELIRPIQKDAPLLAAIAPTASNSLPLPPSI